MELQAHKLVPRHRELVEDRVEDPLRQLQLDLRQLTRRAPRRIGTEAAAEQPLDHPEHRSGLGADDHAGPERRHLDGRVDRAGRHVGERGRPGQLRDVDHLELELDAHLGREARARRAAERLVRALDPALLVLRELGRPREVDVADALRAARATLLALLDEAAVLRRLDEGGDLVGGEDLAHE